MDSQELEARSKAAFAKLRAGDLEPSPFMKSRILARLPEKRKTSTEVLVWRWISGFAVATCALVLTLNINANRAPEGEIALARQSYVIHIDLSGDRVQNAQVAEIELPDGVYFVSKSHPEIAQLRKMTLPVPETAGGRSRLPFVVRSEQPGLKQLKLKILDGENRVIEEKTMPISFTEKV